MVLLSEWISLITDQLKRILNKRFTAHKRLNSFQIFNTTKQMLMVPKVLLKHKRPSNLLILRDAVKKVLADFVR